MGTEVLPSWVLTKRTYVVNFTIANMAVVDNLVGK